MATVILYALPAWGCFLSKELSGKIDVCLKRCYRYGFLSKIECVDTLIQPVWNSQNALFWSVYARHFTSYAAACL